MNAKELRIGNLVQYGIQVKEIKSFTRTDIKPIETTIYIGLTYRLKNYPVDFREIKPIPLTEEWSVKFGYECLVDMACDFSSKSLYPIEITSEDLKLMKVNEAQNLYFALTGQELTIKTE